jgi:hypothetical protein
MLLQQLTTPVSAKRGERPEGMFFHTSFSVTEEGYRIPIVSKSQREAFAQAEEETNASGPL